MYIIFIKFGLPIIIVCFLQVYLSYKDNKLLGLILPCVSLFITAALIFNALDIIGKAYAFTIMLIPNVLSFFIYFATRKYRKFEDSKVIKLKWNDKEDRFK